MHRLSSGLLAGNNSATARTPTFRLASTIPWPGLTRRACLGVLLVRASDCRRLGARDSEEWGWDQMVLPLSVVRQVEQCGGDPSVAALTSGGIIVRWWAGASNGRRASRNKCAVCVSEDSQDARECVRRVGRLEVVSEKRVSEEACGKSHFSYPVFHQFLKICTSFHQFFLEIVKCFLYFSGKEGGSSSLCRPPTEELVNLFDC